METTASDPRVATSRSRGKHRPLHVLLVVPSFPAPGHEYHASFQGTQVRLLCEQEEIRRVTVLVPTTWIPSQFRRWLPTRTPQHEFPNYYELLPGRCTVTFPRYFKAPGNLLLFWTAVQWTRLVDRAVRHWKSTDPVDIIHGSIAMESGWASFKVAQRYRLPSVVTYQGTEVHTVLEQRLKGWRMCRDCFRHAQLNLAVSHSLLSTLRRHAEPLGSCERFLRGVDQRVYFPSGKLENRPHVLYVGRISQAKGIYDLLESWQAIRSAIPQAKLTLVGPDQTEDGIRRIIKQRQLEASVRYLGSISPNEVAQCLRGTRVFCLPSHAEGTPNSVMEALACGVPVVATRVGGIPEIVQEGVSGLLIDPGQPHQIAEAVRSLLADCNLCLKLSNGAREYARRHLDARSAAKRLVRHYLDLVADRS